MILADEYCLMTFHDILVFNDEYCKTTFNGQHAQDNMRKHVVDNMRKRHLATVADVRHAVSTTLHVFHACVITGVPTGRLVSEPATRQLWVWAGSAFYMPLTR